MLIFVDLCDRKPKFVAHILLLLLLVVVAVLVVVVVVVLVLVVVLVVVVVVIVVVALVVVEYSDLGVLLTCLLLNSQCQILADRSQVPPHSRKCISPHYEYGLHSSFRINVDHFPLQH
jgi:hypothetical protein